MQALLSVAGPVFWGLVTFSVLVFLHEGGHFLAARACGVRVTEFFLGMPCRFNIHRTSRRIGTRFGVTPLLIGGYAAICGMDPTEAPAAPAVLATVHRRGRATVTELAEELRISEDDALSACALLLGWGSVAPVYDPERGEGPNSRYYPSTYAAMPRDAAGNTVYDGRAMDRAHATAEGEPWEPPMGDEAFFERERSRTYLGKGFWKRALMLVAGICVNLVTGLLLMMAVYSVVGVESVRDVSVLGSVEAGSPAAEAGLEAGDRILTVDGGAVESWTDVLQALDGAKAGQEVSLTWERDGREHEATVELSDEGRLGIVASTETVRLNPVDSCRIALSSIAQTAQGVARLLVPSQTMEVLDSSTSIVGISVLSSQAASAGAGTFLNFMALISFSLAFMNLLPLPPLDGGKLLIEIIQAVTRRRVPLKVQNGISMAVIALFGLLFVYMLRMDILRFI